jgi:hypothetical protein
VYDGTSIQSLFASKDQGSNQKPPTIPGRLSNPKLKESPFKRVSQKGNVYGSGGFATALFLTPPKVSGSSASGVGLYGGKSPGMLIASSNGKGSSDENSSIKKKRMEEYCSQIFSSKSS